MDTSSCTALADDVLVQGSATAASDAVVKHALLLLACLGCGLFEFQAVPRFIFKRLFGKRNAVHATWRQCAVDWVRCPPASKWQFFVTPKGSLAGKTPLESLREGKLSAVKVAADGFRER